MKKTTTMLLMLVAATALLRAQTQVMNPVLWSDVPDPDVICVGEDYYMVSTTCHMSPGAPIMRSRDMKHWEIISYVFDRLNESPANNLEGGNIYSRGQWAASLRHHDGLFYVFFGTGVHSYVYTAKNPAGPWTMKTKLERYYHDASLLFDDDGSKWLVHCDRGVIYVKQFTDDMQTFTDGDQNGQRIIGLDDGCLHEGVHAYKINGRYYMTTIWWPGGGIRTELCFRSDRLTGPYERKTILSDDAGYRGWGVAQGGIWQTPGGDWYGLLFQDHGGVGRIPYLLPCRWVDGWPMLGDAEGHTPRLFTLPGVKEQKDDERYKLLRSDDFNDKKLGLTWQWNHNPDDKLWTLTERKGWLRLKTGWVVRNLFEARNTLTQRTVGPVCCGTVRMDVSHMAYGDCAGLASFCSEPGTIQVEQKGGRYELVMTDRSEEKARVPLVCPGGIVYLRLFCDFTNDYALFSYSTDGVHFTQLGDRFHMIFSMAHFTGNKFALFNYATYQAGGWVDVDWFECRN